MPAAWTYATLLVDLRRYLERGWTATSDPNVFEELPRLVTLAERRCARELKVLGFQNVVTSTFADGTAVYAKPDRWRATISLNYGSGTGNNTRNPLLPRSYEYLRSYWPTATTTGVPEFYADYDYEHWLIAPTPDAAYPFEALYYQQPPFLDDANQTNWLTDYAPELLLYAALLEATPFLKNDERLTTWTGMYDRAAQATNGEELQKMLDRAAVRGRA